MLKRIYLTGFMTCGKSTIGPILANTLGWEFVDLDDIIETAQKMKIVDIFEKHGEEYFRKIESEALIEISKKEKIIVALGGGTIIKTENLETMKRSGKIIYLKSTPDKIYERIKTKLDRPLFYDLVVANKPKQDFIDRIENLLSKRKDYYERADYVFNTDHDSLGHTVDLIAKKIEKYTNEKN